VVQAPAPPAPKPVVQAPPPEPRPTPAPRAAAPKPADQRKISYKVKSGDTILGLARKYKVTLDEIVRWNAQQLGDRRNLLIGESLVIIPGNNS
jgi:LysM repeat protein